MITGLSAFRVWSDSSVLHSLGVLSGELDVVGDTKIRIISTYGGTVSHKNRSNH